MGFNLAFKKFWFQMELSGHIHTLTPYPGWARGLVWKFGGREKSLTPSTNPRQLLFVYPVSHSLYRLHYSAHSFAEESGKNYVNFNRLAGVPPEI
jgi:hypothetical protein